MDLLKIDDLSDTRQKTLLRKYLNEHPKVLYKDEQKLSSWMKAIASSKLRLEWWLEQVKADRSPRNVALAYLSLIQRRPLSELQDIFDEMNGAPHPLSEIETSLIVSLSGKSLTHPDQPENVRVECPSNHELSLRNVFGAAFKGEMIALLQEANTDLRVNTALTTRENMKSLLQQSGFNVQNTAYSNSGLRLMGAKKSAGSIRATDAYHNGLYDFQDEGSQLIAQVSDVRSDMRVLDYCAGAGGKTLALAAMMQNKGSIVAADLEEHRLQKGIPRLERAGCKDIVTFKALEKPADADWIKEQQQAFDVVLTDVPCSGTGTWRRAPELRWKTAGMNLSDIFKIQAHILETVAPLVKPGGRLVYSTCSLLGEENEQRVETFLAAHPEYKVIPVQDDRLGTPYMRLTPYRHGTDGFFAAVLERQLML